MLFQGQPLTNTHGLQKVSGGMFLWVLTYAYMYTYKVYTLVYTYTMYTLVYTYTLVKVYVYTFHCIEST